MTNNIKNIEVDNNPVLSDLSPKIDYSQLSLRVRKLIWRNRPRRPQSSATPAHSFYDSKGQKYTVYSNGVIIKDFFQDFKLQ